MTPGIAKPLPSAMRCEMLLRQSPGCSWLLKSSGAFEAVFGDARRVFGRDAAELRELNFADVFVPQARSSWLDRLERVFAGRTLCAAGRIGENAPTFSITLFPVRLPEGLIAFAGGMAQEAAEPDLVLSALRTLETDRVRLHQLLHDHVGQYLSAAGLQLDLLRMDLAEGAFPVPERTGEIQTMLETVMASVRDFNYEMSPSVAERLGLHAALDELAGRLRADFDGNLRVLADSTAQAPPGVAAALYRIAEHVVGNAARQAHCSTIEILLKPMRSGTVLEIRLNGHGSGAAESPHQAAGLGLLTMQHYADQAGIDLEIDFVRDMGTVVRALCRGPVTISD